MLLTFSLDITFFFLICNIYSWITARSTVEYQKKKQEKNESLARWRRRQRMRRACVRSFLRNTNSLYLDIVVMRSFFFRWYKLSLFALWNEKTTYTIIRRGVMTKTKKKTRYLSDTNLRSIRYLTLRNVEGRTCHKN